METAGRELRTGEMPSRTPGTVNAYSPENLKAAGRVPHLVSIWIVPFGFCSFPIPGVHGGQDIRPASGALYPTGWGVHIGTAGGRGKMGGGFTHKMLLGDGHDNQETKGTEVLTGN